MVQQNLGGGGCVRTHVSRVTSDVDTSRSPVVIIINSSELRGTGFKFKEVIPPSLETGARGGFRTRGSGL